MRDKPTDLYRHYDADGRLLHVGISLSAFARLKQHKAGAQWVGNAVTMHTVTHSNRAAAREAEIEAIRSENPLWNKADRHEALAADVSARRTRARENYRLNAAIKAMTPSDKRAFAVHFIAQVGMCNGDTWNDRAGRFMDRHENDCFNAFVRDRLRQGQKPFSQSPQGQPA
jgi:hypothetical protein